MIPPGRLDRPVDHETDHVLGPADAEITLVEYGSYACPHCRAANERIADQLGDRVCYAFRHRPLADNSLAFRAAEFAEPAQTSEAFWSAHIKLMTRSMPLTVDDLVAVANRPQRERRIRTRRQRRRAARESEGEGGHRKLAQAA
jgi:NhaA family Na+:H+ antiporter